MIRLELGLGSRLVAVGTLECGRNFSSSWVIMNLPCLFPHVELYKEKGILCKEFVELTGPAARPYGDNPEQKRLRLTRMQLVR
jgi:hypothetical protein